jgi:ABC-2 type transport system ATP-binding protein
MVKKVVQVERLVKTYGDIKAVDEISFQVEKGEIFGMLGPNGAGKTTTVEIIEGLRPADSGKVLVMDMNVSQVPDKVKQRIGVQLQAPSLLPLLKVGETLKTFAGFYRYSSPVNNILELLALKESENMLVKNLSGGQKQRLSVALALVNDPEIAFLDEPTTGLDPQARRNLWSVVEDMRNKNKTIFLTTHYMDEAERLCDRLVIMDHGKIIAQGSPEDLIRQYFQEKAIEFEMDPVPLDMDLDSLPGVTNTAVNGSEVIIYTEDVPSTMSALLQYAENNGLTRFLKDLLVREASLEDVFLKLTGRKIRE